MRCHPPCVCPRRDVAPGADETRLCLCIVRGQMDHRVVSTSHAKTRNQRFVANWTSGVLWREGDLWTGIIWLRWLRDAADDWTETARGALKTNALFCRTGIGKCLADGSAAAMARRRPALLLPGRLNSLTQTEYVS